jgi:hypothetical protein
MTAPTVESRRPSSGRLVGFAALLAAVSWGLGAFAAYPWAGSEPGVAVIRVAFKHVAAFEHQFRALSKEELERLPRHMRPTAPERARTGRRVPTALAVDVDGHRLLQKSYVPGGFRHDGPTFGYEEIAVRPGHHLLQVTLADERAEQAQDETRRQWQLEQEIEIPTGRALLIEFSERAGLTLR